MTYVEMLTRVMANDIDEEVVAKAAELKEKHESEAQNRRDKAAEKRAEKLEAEKALEDAIFAVLSNEPMTASDIRDAVEGIETPQKATVITKRLVEVGLAKVEKIKGKNGKVNGYTKA